MKAWRSGYHHFGSPNVWQFLQILYGGLTRKAEAALKKTPPYRLVDGME